MGEKYSSDVYCETANELIKHLNDWQSQSSTKNQFFRGQTADKELKPSLFRDDDKIQSWRKSYIANLEFNSDDWNKAIHEKCVKLNDYTGDPNPHGHTNIQAEKLSQYWLTYDFEKYLLTSFFNVANQAGLHVNYSNFHTMHKHYGIVSMKDDLSYHLSSKSEYLYSVERLWRINKGNNVYPLVYEEDHALLSIAALAQHNGVPTRLLDFTKSALKAAFFAVYSSINKEGGNGEQKIYIYRVAITNKDQARIEFIDKHDNYLNQFLFAQEALFAFLFNDRDFLENGQWLSVEELSEKYGGIEIERLSFPKEKSWELLEILKLAHNISISKLMPSYYYAAKEINMILENKKQKG